MNTVQKFEARQLEQLQSDLNIPEFSPGDTIRVNVKIREGSRERVQAFEGVCIAKRGHSMNTSFTVRKISYGEGVERVFPLYSPRIESIELVRRGSVRRAKLYYLRSRRGKSARISERTSGRGLEQNENGKAKTEKESKTENKTAAPKKAEEKKEAKKPAAKKETGKKSEKKDDKKED